MKIAILTRSAASSFLFVNAFLNKGNDEAIKLIIDLDKPMKLNKNRYSVVDRININIYRITRRLFFISKSSNKYNVPIIKINDLIGDEINDYLKKNNIDLLLLRNAPILSKKVLDKITCSEILNLHSGYLPEYKGASCGLWPVVNNDDKIGISIHEVSEKLDQGKIIVRKQIPFTKIPFSLKYPKYISDMQNELFVEGVIEIINSNKKMDSTIENTGFNKYYSLPTFTAYLKGLFNLLKLKLR